MQLKDWIVVKTAEGRLNVDRRDPTLEQPPS